MGAVLISRNDVAVSNPGLAARLEEALARAVARSPRAYRASIVLRHGHTTAHLSVEEHPPSDPGVSRRETALDLTLDAAVLHRAIHVLLA